MATTIDARGLSCPEPVILTKKALAAHSGFSILVDNEVSKENIQRFCDKAGAKTSFLQNADGWEISVSK